MAVLLLAFLPAVAQNTATTSGNWNDCATWGNPTSVLQNNTDTKTINNGVTVTVNTNWSTQNITVNGNGAIDFASSNNSIDFVTDGGADKTCTVACITPTLSAVTGTGTVAQDLAMAKAFTITASNYTTLTWTIKNSGGTTLFSGTGLTTGSRNLSTADTYTITFIATNATSGCTASTSVSNGTLVVTDCIGGAPGTCPYVVNGNPVSVTFAVQQVGGIGRLVFSGSRFTRINYTITGPNGYSISSSKTNIDPNTCHYQEYLMTLPQVNGAYTVTQTYIYDKVGCTANSLAKTNTINVAIFSDKRFKDNITPIENALEKITKLSGYTYDWKDSSQFPGHDDLPQGHDMGVIAQEVEKIFPEAVTTHDDGFKSVKYIQLIPALIEAVKTQQEMMKTQQSQINMLIKKLENSN